ncbi:hypothetical protein [Pseudomonas aeruginosa]|uniref:hypothetical protein n=1 Tax=Pseudomonas aeruginosa TaxID=287 RepID=UPI0021E1B991|nr:hypothetical protein [Pseudomonas aeruginosa]EMB2824059.1 hypothetical protein [Pseudomonas aeruginosa]GLF10546.1 hypothetical protein VNPA131183_40050 [Pseudomonas aeruginosa]HBO5717098.1 hypothetical protein [Pseudomonas aeruginosa]HBO5814031.1 hypothetical protein [Pseudomonas aeruginosa]HBO7424830.1 hypothetical protein [Pseudomonas aeruginosa]
MRLQELFKIAQQAGNAPEGVVPDKREALTYMDVMSSEYRKQAAKLTRYSR